MKSEANLQPIRQDKVEKEHDSDGCSTCNAVIANKNNRRCIVKKTFAENSSCTSEQFPIAGGFVATV